jgi:hypothetical protein
MLHWWCSVVVAIRVQMSHLWAQFDCGESVTVFWQKGVVGGCNNRRRAEYVLQQTAEDGQWTIDTSLLSGPTLRVCAWTQPMGPSL